MVLDAICEILPEAGGTRWVEGYDDVALFGEDHHVPAGGPDVFGCALGTAVNVECEGVFLAFDEVGGFDYPGLEQDIMVTWIVDFRDLAAGKSPRSPELQVCVNQRDTAGGIRLGGFNWVDPGVNGVIEKAGCGDEKLAAVQRVHIRDASLGDDQFGVLRG